MVVKTIEYTKSTYIQDLLMQNMKVLAQLLYDPCAFFQVISGDTTIWMQYYDNQFAEDMMKQAQDDWLKLQFRHKCDDRKKSVPDISVQSDPATRIVQR